MTIQRNDTAPTPESDEDYVRDLIDAAMSGTRPPLDLSTAALARGRRLRTRRRSAWATTAVAASVLAARDRAVDAAAAARPQRTTADQVVATAPPAPPEHRPGWWDMPATEMVSAVEAILPDGVVVTSPGPLIADSPAGGPATGWINPQVDASSGPGRLNVMLYRDPYSFTVASEDTMPTPSDGSTPGADSEPGRDHPRHRSGPHELRRGLPRPHRVRADPRRGRQRRRAPTHPPLGRHGDQRGRPRAATAASSTRRARTRSTPSRGPAHRSRRHGLR